MMPQFLPWAAAGVLLVGATFTVGIDTQRVMPLRAPLETVAATALWRSRFAGERFIEIADELPTLRDVQHRNVARIAMRAAAHVRTPTLLVFSAIDNLMKGAAGQAMQNANLMLDLDETMGLPA